MSPGRRRRRPDDVIAMAHALRSSLNGIHTWAHVLEARLGADPEAPVRKALDGIHRAIAAHVRVIESLPVATTVEPPSRGTTMGRRRDGKR